MTKEMENLYNVDDPVIISGSFTGYGDLKGRVLEVNFMELANEYYYNILTDIQKFYCQEKFIKMVG